MIDMVYNTSIVIEPSSQSEVEIISEVGSTIAVGLSVSYGNNTSPVRVIWLYKSIPIDSYDDIDEAISLERYHDLILKPNETTKTTIAIPAITKYAKIVFKNMDENESVELSYIITFKCATSSAMISKFEMM